MLEKLFSSKTRVKVLKLFLFNSQNSFYQRQISTITCQSIRGIQRELIKLEEIGLIEKSTQGNRIYYKANQRCAIFEQLKIIFLKSVGIAEILKNNIKEPDKINAAFIYGSYAKGQETLISDIDLMVIGNITAKELSFFLSKPKKELLREINYIIFPQQEFRARIMNKDHFLNTVLREKKIFIIGDQNELKTISHSR